MTPKLIGTCVPIFSLKTTKNSEVGTFFAAIEFLDWLAKTNQNAWQILPLHESQLEEWSSTKHIPSPYKGYGIGIDPKYLSDQIDTPTPTASQISKYIQENSEWLIDYATFCVIRDYYKTDNWTKWETSLRSKDNKVVDQFIQSHKKEFDWYVVLQWRLNYQFEILKTKAKQLGIKLVGDLPFYISHRSPIVWANQKLFDLNSDGSINGWSGVPEVKSKHFIRQIWGHPLYRWDDDSKVPKLIKLWKIRIKYLSTLYDWVRLDHANGFYHYGKMNTNDSTKDKLIKGPGTFVFKKIVNYCKQLNLGIYVENIGERIKDLNNEIKRGGLYQIQVWIYGLKKRGSLLYNSNFAKVPKYTNKMFVSTTTHDTETLLDFIEKLTLDQRKLLAKRSEVMLHADSKDYCRKIVDAIYHSNAYGVILPIQDRLLTKDRINIPGTEKAVNDTNWKYVLNIPVEKLPLN